jgi:anthranilate synthase component 1
MPHSPVFEEFADRARRSSMVTVHRRVSNDFLTPINAFCNLDRGLSCEGFLLESVEGGDKIARYSFVAVDPFLHFEAQRERATITPGVLADCEDWTAAGQYVGGGDPIDALRSVLARYQAVPGLPDFCGGAVGYMGYDTIRYTENLPNAPDDDRHLPDMAFDIYGSVVIFDHADKTITVTANAPIDRPDMSETELRAAYATACRKVDDLLFRLEHAVASALLDVDLQAPVARGFDRSNFEPEEFQDAVRKCKEYIAAGDIFQVVISQRFEIESSADPFDIYRALRVVNPSPFMFYLRTGETILVGSSPEIMVRVQNGTVTIRPLAGTRPRGRTPEEDIALEKDLLADEKERAEHVMLVDLARNDVGRVARLGSVKIDDVMSIERYSHVMHISSTVTGELAVDKTPLDAVRSGLPAGTVSGAPKVRAMEIIDELEPHRRGPYAGAVGFIDFTGNIETCLALRTLVCQGNKIYIQAGAGVVHDSVPEKEYQETINKAKGLLKAIEVAETWRSPMSGNSSNETPEVLSCIQPTADLHIGNYFGAVANWVELQNTRSCLFGVVDLHAMTMPYDPDRLRANTNNMVVDLLACGIDPEKTTLFVQSLVPEHNELMWILSCLCSYGDLGRMTQFKDKSQILASEKSDDFVSAGLFVYPVLQAADILAYRAKFVPVGKDQEQHLELARTIARRFNQTFDTEFFPEPQPLFTRTPKIMSLADPESKMSKSAGDKHCIGLFEEEASIRKKVKTAVTDSGELPAGVYMSPGVANMFEIIRACGKDSLADEMEAEYKKGDFKYGPLKQVVADALVEVTSRLRARREEIAAQPEVVDRHVRQAREIAAETLRGVRKLTGLPQMGK